MTVVSFILLLPGGLLAAAQVGVDSEAKTSSVSPDELGRCLMLIQAGRFDEAREVASALVRADAQSSRAHLLLALTYHKQRRYGLAEPLFARAAELEPQDHLIWMYYGWCLYNLGEADRARERFDAFLEVQPDYGDAHYALGLLDFDANDVKSATARFERAIELARSAGQMVDEAKARARLGDIYVQAGRLAEARKELEQAIGLNPDLYGAYFKLSRVLQRLGDAQGAHRAREKHRIVRQRVRPERGHAE